MPTPGVAVVPGVEPSVIRLAEGALKTMTALNWKLTATAVALVCAVSAVTAGMLGFAAPPVPPPAVPVAAVPAAEPEKPAASERTADARQACARSRNNMKLLVIAMHGYHDANGHFPQNIVDKDGKPLLSWRVELLPFLEAEKLYTEFKRDEPWDSEHNKKLLAKMPDVFRVGFEPKGETKTYYQGFAGAGTIFDPSQKVTLATITDGTSTTLAIVEAGAAGRVDQAGRPPLRPEEPATQDGRGRSQTRTLIGRVTDGGTHAFPPRPGRDQPAPHDRDRRR